MIPNHLETKIEDGCPSLSWLLINGLSFLFDREDLSIRTCENVHHHFRPMCVLCQRMMGRKRKRYVGHDRRNIDAPT